MREAAAGLPRSNPLVLKWSETEQGKPMRMAFAGHQFPRALADALGKPAAHETPMIEEPELWIRGEGIPKRSRI